MESRRPYEKYAIIQGQSSRNWKAWIGFKSFLSAHMCAALVVRLEIGVLAIKWPTFYDLAIIWLWDSRRKISQRAIHLHDNYLVGGLIHLSRHVLGSRKENTDANQGSTIKKKYFVYAPGDNNRGRIIRKCWWRSIKLISVPAWSVIDIATSRRDCSLGPNNNNS